RRAGARRLLARRVGGERVRGHRLAAACAPGCAGDPGAVRGRAPSPQGPSAREGRAGLPPVRGRDGLSTETAAAAAARLLSPRGVRPRLAGGVALVSQSGAMLLHFHRMAQARGIGLAATVSIGNEGMLTAADFFEAFIDDPRVKVIGALLEGIRDAAGFLRASERALAAGKPLVVFKVGHTEAGRRSISAHTGSLAGEDEVLDAVFRRHGVVRVRSLEELVETCALLAHAGWPAGSRTAVLTTSGGACGIVSDLVEGTGIEM